jgi:hypothetical protein
VPVNEIVTDPVERLMKLSGAVTRFELAVQAGKLGWL